MLIHHFEALFQHKFVYVHLENKPIALNHSVEIDEEVRLIAEEECAHIVTTLTIAPQEGIAAAAAQIRVLVFQLVKLGRIAHHDVLEMHLE